MSSGTAHVIYISGKTWKIKISSQYLDTFNVSPLKVSKANCSYFEFQIQNSTNQSRTVCFSPKKRKLIESIATGEDYNIGCELVNVKKSDNGDLLVTNFTSVKRVKLNFEKPSLIISYSTVSEIMNEKPIYTMINVKGTKFNLEETEQKVCKYGKILQLRKAVFKDSTDCIPITFFDKNVSNISEAKGYQIINVCVSLFQAQRLLQTTDTTEIIKYDNRKYYFTEVESSISSLKKKT